MDGIETANCINELTAPTIPPLIIMDTVSNRENFSGPANMAGIRKIMTKPMSASTILDALSDILGRKLQDKEAVVKVKKGNESSLVEDFIGMQILLAEDNEVNQLVACRILRNAGLKVDIANNGLEAVNMVETGNYDLVLMDIQMPVMDGIAATHEIRSKPDFKNLPILAMTANAMRGDREMSLKAGMNDHISKPIDLKEMFSTLARWLKKRNAKNMPES